MKRVSLAVLVSVLMVCLLACPTRRRGNTPVGVSSAPTFVLAWNDHTHHIVTLESENATGWSRRYDHGPGAPEIGPAVAYDGGTTYLLTWVAQGDLWTKAGVRGSDPAQGIRWDPQPTRASVGGSVSGSPAVAFGANRWVAVFRLAGAQNQLAVMRSGPLSATGWGPNPASAVAPITMPGSTPISVVSARAPALAFGALAGRPMFLLVFVAPNGHAIGASSTDGSAWFFFADFGVAEKDPAVTYADGRFYVVTSRVVASPGLGLVAGFHNFVHKVISESVITRLAEIQAPQNAAGPGVALGGCTIIVSEQIGAALGGPFDGISLRRATPAVCEESTSLNFGPDTPVGITLTVFPAHETTGDLDARTALVFGRATPQRPPKVLIAGGAENEAEAYDIRGGTFALLSNRMQHARNHPVGLLLKDGNILILGGTSLQQGASVIGPPEKFHLSGEVFSLTRPWSTPRNAFSAVRLADGRVLITGGRPGSLLNETIQTAEIYDPGLDTMQFTAGPMLQPRKDHTSTLLENGDVLIAGGNSWPFSLDSAELFQPAAGTFVPTGAMTDARQFHAATRLYDGRVLITGGERISSPAAPNEPSLATAMVYTPATGQFTPVGAMNTARVGHAATLLPNGKVLITGGRHDEFVTALASAEIFDPNTGTFSPAGNMVRGRTLHTAVLLENGLVLITGGLSDQSAELYDFRSGMFTATGNMVRSRFVHVAIPYR